MTATGLHARRWRLVRGEGTYVADVALSDQLSLGVVRSQDAHGYIRSIGTAAASETPGVVAVLTARDLDVVPHIPVRKTPFPGMEHRLQPVLATERVRYVGEPVAVVLAEDVYAAEAAVEQVDVQVDPLPAVVDARADAPSIYGDDLDNVLCHYHARAGDVDAAFAQAAVVVRETFRTGRHTGLPIETRGLVARWREDGDLEVWGPAKFVHWTRGVLASMLDVPVERVHCHRVDVGGMFGPRGEFYPEDFLVPWAARVVGRPVKWIEDRREHLVATNHSREQVHDYELAVAADGTLLGYRDRVVVDMGAYPRPIGGRVPELVVETLPGPYRWHTFDVVCEGVASNKTPVGTVRGPAAFEANFVRERAIDIAAGELGADPVALRRQNLIPRHEIPYRREFACEIAPIEYDSGDYPRILDRIVAEGDIAGMRNRARVRRDVGFGFACFVEPSGIGVAETVAARLDAHGCFELSTSASEVGQGLEEMILRVATDALGVAASQCRVTSGSSAHAGGTGTFGSRGAIFVGNAIHRACTSLVQEARSEVARRTSVPFDEIRAEPQGWVAGAHVVPWAALAPLEAHGGHEAEEPTWGFGCHAVEASVDRGTGIVDVQRLVVGYDCGRALDPAAVVGQLAGAAVQALGGTMLEELVFDAVGQPQVTSLMDYLVPTACEAPEIMAVVCEDEPAPGNPLGVKGAGEAGVAGVAPAIANAVVDAFGLGAARGCTELPLRPERVAALSTLSPSAPHAAASAAMTPIVASRVKRIVACATILAVGAFGAIVIGRRRRRSSSR